MSKRVVDLVANYLAVKKKIELACQTHNRNAKDIELLAVSKNHPAALIEQLYQECGHRDFAENYCQELLEKSQQLKHLTELRWHFIGPLQSNKIAKLVPIVTSIQTLTSEKHARFIAQKIADFRLEKMRVYIAVNAENESQKSGVSMEQVELFYQTLKANYSEHLIVQGIMSIPPADYSDDQYPNSVPKLYADLANLARRIGAGNLSLGMSGDLSLAIRAGTNCLRIGSAIFGDRT